MGEPFLLQRGQLAVEIEAVEGTAETLVAADLIAPIFEPEYTPNFEQGDREAIQPSFSQIKKIQGERSATFAFATEMKGSGTAGTVPANLSKLLRACGFSETIVAVVSVTYAPASENVPSLTMIYNELAQDGTVFEHQIVGARGTVVFEVVKGQIMLARFEFTGRYIKPIAGTLLTPQPTLAPDPEAALAIAFSFQGQAGLLAQNITLDMANEVTLRNDVNEATGNFSAIITNRIPTGSIDPERKDPATVNFFTALEDNTEGILTFVLGSTAGNILTLTAPAVQVINIGPGDRDGIRIDALDLMLNQSVVAGDDELSLAFT